MKEKYWKYSLIIIIIGLGIILFRQITPFLGGLLGALTIYILVRKQMIYLGARMKRSFAALLITGEAILCFLVPISLIVWMLVNKLQDINLDPQAIITPVEELAGIIKAKTGYDVLGSDTLSFIVSLLPKIGQAVMGGISSFAVNLFVLVFVLYFMLIGGTKMEAYIDDILPFNEKNTREVTHEINMIVRSNAIGIPLACSHSGRGSPDRLFHLRSTECLADRSADLLLHNHPDGGDSLGMVSGSRLSCTDRRVGKRHRTGGLRWNCRLAM